MRFKVDLSLDLWLVEVEVEADSLEAAKDELSRKVILETKDLIQEAIVKSADYSNDDWKLIERHVTVKIKNIVYDVSEQDAEDNNMTVEQIVDSLPTELTVDFNHYEKYDIESDIEDEISDKTGWLVKTYDFEIIKED